MLNRTLKYKDNRPIVSVIQNWYSLDKMKVLYESQHILPQYMYWIYENFKKYYPKYWIDQDYAVFEVGVI